MEKLKNNKVMLGVWWVIIITYYIGIGLVIGYVTDMYDYMLFSLYSLWMLAFVLSFWGFIIYITALPFRQMRYSIKTNDSGYFWKGLALFVIQNILLIMSGTNLFFATNEVSKAVLGYINTGLVATEVAIIALFIYQKYKNIPEDEN